MANTSLPCSDASRAVIREPDSSAASTTRVLWDSPAMMRLRRGKLAANGGVPRGYSLSITPRWTMRCARSRCCLGYTRSRPVPTTAIVASWPSIAPSNAPAWAAPSTPKAIPETMVRPACANVCENWRALAAPCAVGLRLPTTAKLRDMASANPPSCQIWGAPMAYSSRGGSSMLSSDWG